MGNPYDNIEQLVVYSGNKAGVLSTSTGELALTAGVWEIWATQAYQIQVQKTTGQSLGTGPQIWPANYVSNPIRVPLTSTWYVLHRADISGYSTAGYIRANMIATAMG